MQWHLQLRFKFNWRMKSPVHQLKIVQNCSTRKDLPRLIPHVQLTPMSHSSLCRILNVCSASKRKSLQGLNHFTADGAKAFNDIQEVIENLGHEYGRGHTWVKDMNIKLKTAKRYLKSDYKVCKIIGYLLI